jgi:hypothetical protein
MGSLKPIIYACLVTSILCASAATTLAQSTCVKPFAIVDGNRNVGDPVTLKPGAAITPGWYGALNLNGVSGGAEYRENIEGCNSRVLAPGDFVDMEPGNLTGPTKQGVSTLFGQDPDAYWDSENQCVVTGVTPTSPRVIAIPLYDPTKLENGQVQVTRVVDFFIEAILGGKEVVGRVTTRDPDRTCRVTETNETICNDRRDNDGDGAIDCQDDDCRAVCVP